MSWWGGGSSASKPKAPAGHARKGSGGGGAHSVPIHTSTHPSAPVSVSKPVDVPVSDGPATSSKWGGVSPRSAAAMDKMEGLSAQLDGMEAQVTVMKAVIDNDAVTRAQLLEAKDQIAQLNGNLEKLQYTGVDSIVTAELESGREMAKLRRKSLNKRCDALRERILEASGVIASLLKAS